MRFPSIVVFLAYAANTVVANIFEEDGTVDLTPLGTYDLSELEYSLDFALDENSCEYSLEVGFSHQSEFFVGSADTCRPGVNDPYDGRSVLEGRWRFQSFPSYIEASTGLDHVSIDYNPCGHPGPGFLVPHYDLHFYRVSPAYRIQQMVCDLNPGIPTCAADQSTPEGQAFFELDRSLTTNELVNMPRNFEALMPDAVIFMGLHALDTSTMPKETGDWKDPVYVMCSYDSQIVAIEPMFPFQYVSGEQDQSYSEDIEYVDQTVADLPNHYSVEYKADTNRTIVTLKGTSNICSQKELDDLIEKENGGSDDSPATTLMLSNLIAFFFVGGIGSFLMF